MAYVLIHLQITIINILHINIKAMMFVITYYVKSGQFSL